MKKFRIRSALALRFVARCAAAVLVLALAAAVTARAVNSPSSRAGAGVAGDASVSSHAAQQKGSGDAEAI